MSRVTPRFMDQVLQLEHFYCPLCGGREALGHRCGCELLWTEERRGMGHYAVLLSGGDAEKLRHKLARRLTRKLVERDGAVPVKVPSVRTEHGPKPWDVLRPD